MKRKILLAISLTILSSIAMADSAQGILKKTREDYYREQKELEAAEKAEDRKAREAEKAEKKAAAKEKAEDEDMDVDVYYDEEEYVEEKVKPKTPMEKLEYNLDNALTKVDFYERVVRSVAREEKELDSYNEIMGKKKPVKTKKVKKK